VNVTSKSNNRGKAGKIDSETASRILRPVSVQKSFLFFTDVGQYTGEFARSLEEFYEKISNAPLKSLDFHFKRGDFEKWIEEILGDTLLAERIKRMDRTVQGKKLRMKLKGTVKRRLNQLKKNSRQ